MLKKCKKKFCKRLLILLLSVFIVFSSVSNASIKARAMPWVGYFAAHSLYEIVLYIGCAVVTVAGIGYAYENRDALAELGKNFVDSIDLANADGWYMGTSEDENYLTSYVYGTEALKEVQNSSWEVIQGGGQTPKNNQDNDGDGDKDFDDRSLELNNVSFWATHSFAEFIYNNVKDAVTEVHEGRHVGSSSKDNFLANYFNLALAYDGIKYDGTYPMNGSKYTGKAVVMHDSYKYFISYEHYSKVGGYVENGRFGLRCLNSTGSFATSLAPTTQVYQLNSSGQYEFIRTNTTAGDFTCVTFSANIPVFPSIEQANAYVLGNADDSSAINKPNSKVYTVADWLQEDWNHPLDFLTGIRTLGDLTTIAGALSNQALINQLNGLGWIEALNQLLAQYAALPATVTNPTYLPDNSGRPDLDPGQLPGNGTVPNPEPDPVEPTPSPEEPEEPDDPELDTNGLSALIGIILLLILIIIMLLRIFLSCLAFIVSIFKVPRSTVFLNEYMIMGLDYLKTTEIPGFGVSIYDLFMGLIYILLMFSVIAVIRKNIDRIRFPRKRGS